MSRAPVARITGLGVFVPSRIVTNHDLEATLDTNDEWIAERTGIRARRVANADETLTYMCVQAATRALANAGAGPDDIDAIVLATTSPDHLMPATACEVQAALGSRKSVAYDLHAACAGFIVALTVAEGLIAGGRARRILVIGGEKLSTITDWKDRGTAILFADGAGAVVVEPATGDGRGILSSVTRTDGRQFALLNIPGGGSADPISEKVVQERSHFMHMQGREVFKMAVREMAAASDEAIRQADLTPDDVQYLIPHQANLRIIESTAKHAGLSMDRVVVNVDRYGNTSSASIPIALAEAVEDGRVKPGSIVLFTAFGAGLTWGSMVVRW